MAAVTLEPYDIRYPAPATLDDVRDPDDRSFPTEMLVGETALVLFAQAWYGRQDAYYVARAGLAGSCVDVRDHHFDAMRSLYPDGWEFVQADVYEFVVEENRMWDVVTVDCPSGHFERCAELLPVFCGLARHAVILGAGSNEVRPPDGWKIAKISRRSFMYGGVYWVGLTRD